MLKLYSYYRSSAAFRVRIALELKGLDWESIPVNLRLGGQKQQSFQQNNPQGLIPLLELNGQFFAQSLAIIEYLEEMHPDPQLLPSGITERAQVRGMAYQVAMEIHPLNNLRVLKYLEDELGLDEDKKSCWYQHWIAEGFSAFEKTLRNYGSEGQFCFGDSPSLADLCLIPQVYNGLRFKCDHSAYPLIQAIWDNCTKLEAFKTAAPENQLDASTA
jgi:maleylpyruvate isomerase